MVGIPNPTDPEPESEPQYNTQPTHNLIKLNTLRGSGSSGIGFNDITDQTTDSGTLGTANTYQGNVCGSSSPVGLCSAAQAEPSFELFQNLADGATGFKIGKTTPVTGSASSLLLGGFQAQLSYDGSCVNMLDVREMDFPITGLNIDNVAGIAAFDGFVAGGVPRPLDLGHALNRLMGGASQPGSVQMGLTDLSDVAGNPIGFDPPLLTRDLQWGDARADGVVNIADALFIAQSLVGSRPECSDVVATTCVHSVNAASVRQDGSFDQQTIADPLFIAQFLAGLRDENYNTIP